MAGVGGWARRGRRCCQRGAWRRGWWSATRARLGARRARMGKAVALRADFRGWRACVLAALWRGAQRVGPVGRQSGGGLAPRGAKNERSAARLVRSPIQARRVMAGVGAVRRAEAVGAVRRAEAVGAFGRPADGLFHCDRCLPRRSACSRVFRARAHSGEQVSGTRQKPRGARYWCVDLRHSEQNVYCMEVAAGCVPQRFVGFIIEFNMLSCIHPSIILQLSHGHPTPFSRVTPRR